MIENEDYKNLLEKGLLLDHYFLLLKIKNNEEIVKTKRIEGFKNLLIKKKLIENDKLTELGISVLKNSKVDNIDWYARIFNNCKLLIKDLTGSPQCYPSIEKKSYNFICGEKDFKRILEKVVKQYNLKDFNKIEKVLLNYIEECNRTNNWFPLLQYFMLKNGTSPLVSKLESPDDDQKDYKSNQTFI